MNADEKVTVILEHVKLMAKYAHRMTDKFRAFDATDFFYFRGQEVVLDEVVEFIEKVNEVNE